LLSGRKLAEMIEAIPITQARRDFLPLVEEVSAGVKKVLLTKLNLMHNLTLRQKI
jgi:hypothetical protein